MSPPGDPGQDPARFAAHDTNGSEAKAMNDAQTTGGGVGFTGLLTLLFIGLKLGHVITWSWLWVLAPLWGGVAFVLLTFAIVAVVAVVRKR